MYIIHDYIMFSRGMEVTYRLQVVSRQGITEHHQSDPAAMQGLLWMVTHQHSDIYLFLDRRWQGHYVEWALVCWTEGPWDYWCGSSASTNDSGVGSAKTREGMRWVWWEGVH